MGNNFVFNSTENAGVLRFIKDVVIADSFDGSNLEFDYQVGTINQTKNGVETIRVQFYIKAPSSIYNTSMVCDFVSETGVIVDIDTGHMDNFSVCINTGSDEGLSAIEMNKSILGAVHSMARNIKNNQTRIYGFLVENVVHAKDRDLMV